MGMPRSKSLLGQAPPADGLRTSTRNTLEPSRALATPWPRLPAHCRPCLLEQWFRCCAGKIVLWRVPVRHKKARFSTIYWWDWTTWILFCLSRSWVHHAQGSGWNAMFLLCFAVNLSVAERWQSCLHDQIFDLYGDGSVCVEDSLLGYLGILGGTSATSSYSIFGVHMSSLIHIQCQFRHSGLVLWSLVYFPRPQTWIARPDGVQKCVVLLLMKEKHRTHLSLLMDL